MIVLNLLLLVIAAVSITILVSILLTDKNRFHRYTENTYSQVVKKSNNSIFYQFSEPFIRNELAKYGFPLKKEYYHYIVWISGIVIAILFYSLFNSILIAIMSISIGLLLPKLLVIVQKRKYTKTLINECSMYMKAVANAVSISSNLSVVLSEIRKDMPEAVQLQIDKTLSLLASGAIGKETTEHINETYPFSQLQLFHNMLHLLMANTSENNSEILIDISSDFDRQKVSLAKLKRLLTEERRLNNLISMVLVIGPVIINLNPYIHKVIVDNSLERYYLIISYILTAFVWFKVEEINNYNPITK